MKRKCECGNIFRTSQSRIDAGGGKFCSRECAYENRIRRSGLTYNIVEENAGWFKAGEESPDWKGVDVSYSRLHKWVVYHRGPANDFPCDHCGLVQAVDWANITHTYERELDDYMPLCRQCHSDYDAEDKRMKKNEARNRPDSGKLQDSS